MCRFPEAKRFMAERYDSAEPMNLGAGFEISMKDLAEKISSIIEYKGNVYWDISKPNGQPRRSLDVSRATDCIGFSAETGIDLGLAATIHWYDSK